MYLVNACTQRWVFWVFPGCRNRIMRGMQRRVDLDLAQSIRVPGLGGLSKVGVDNEGTVSMAVPDPLDTRCRHLGTFTLNGDWKVRSHWRGEFLQSLMVAPGACRAVGFSREALYVLGEKGKERVALDRRGTWVSTSIARESPRFVAVLQDLFGDTGAILYSTLSGEPIWSLETPFTPTVSAIDPTGSTIAVAGSDGTVVQHDGQRRVVWRHWVDDSVVDLICLADGRCLALVGGGGSRGAGVLVIGPEGDCSQFIPLPSPGNSLCADSDGRRFVVACPGADGFARLLSGDVHGGVDLDEVLPGCLSGGPVKLGISPSASYIGVQSSTGSLDLFRLAVRGRSRSEQTRHALEAAEVRFRSTEPMVALRWLANEVRNNPSDPQLLDLFRHRRQEEVDRRLQEADDLVLDGRWETAFLHLDGWVDALGANPKWAFRREQIREAMLENWLHSAEEHEEGADLDAARTLYRKVFRYEPLHRDAAAGLMRVETRLADEEMALAKDAMAQRRFRECLERLSAAESLGADAAITAPLWQECRVAEALLFAEQLYESRNYGAAEYQYERVLELCPGHPGALRGLNFARALKGDTQIDGRFSRLE